jgi:aminoglycoside 2'-N-acetyltransferase I
VELNEDILTMESKIAIDVIGERDISREVYAGILDLCTGAYGFDFEPVLKTFNNATHVLGWYRGELVTHALWITRWLQCSVMPPWRTAYVEAVATCERYRNRGFASLIMKRLAEEIKDFDIGALSIGSFHFYARLGWLLWRGPLSIRKGAELLPTPGDSVMVLSLPGTPGLDIYAPLSAEWREGELW